MLRQRRMWAAGLASIVAAGLLGALAVPAAAATSAQNRVYVNQVFIDLEGREPNPPLANYFTGQLDSGKPLASAAQFVLVTTEYLAVVVDRLYRELLLRAPDPGGQLFWTDQMRPAPYPNLGVQTVAAQFMGSPDYFDVHGANNSDFVSALYRDIFHREADEAGHDFWVSTLPDPSTSSARQGLVATFAAQAEASRAIVERLYLELLGREPDSAGLQFWSDQLLAGTRQETLIVLLVTSAEYFERAQSQVVPTPPIARDDAVSAPGGPVAIHVVANDVDVDGNLDPGSVAVIDDHPDYGAVVPNAPEPGWMTYTPSPGFAGSDFFFYRICDTSSPVPLCDTARVRVVVTVARPEAVDDGAATPEDTEVVIDVLANDAAAPGRTLVPATVAVVGAPTHGTTSVASESGGITFTPEPDFNGGDSFVYQVCDDVGGCDTATVSVTVDAVPDAPVAVDDSYSVEAGATLVIDAAGGVLTNDTDADHDPLAAAVTDGPSCGSLDSFAFDGSFTFTAPSTPGTCTFTYQASDASATSDPATVTITVG